MRSTKFITAIFLLISSVVFSQQMRMISAADAVFIHEIKALIKFENESLIAEVLPTHAGQSADEKIDLQTGDEILFINGERVKSIDEARKAYESIEKGETVQLGVKRDKERFFTSFTRAEMKGGGMFTIKKDKGGNVSTTGGAEVKDGKVIINGKEVDLDSLKKAGNVRIIEKSDTSKTIKK